MKRETFAKICAILKSLPYGTAAPFDDEIRTAYELYLKQVPEDVAIRLIPAIMRGGFRFRPAPGDVLELADLIANGPKRGVVEAIEEAFDKRRRLGARAIHDGWYYGRSGGELIRDKAGEPVRIPRMIEGPPPFDDLVIGRVVNILGGWEAFCNVPADRESYLRHEFQKIYSQLEGGAGGAILRQLSSEYLAGLLEQARPMLAEPMPYIEGEFTEVHNNSAAEDSPPDRYEAVQIMARIGAGVKQLAGSDA